MTPVQTQPRPADPATVPLTGAESAGGTDASGPQVRDDMTVELALSVMSGSGAGHLFLCDEDDQCTGLITRARLIAVREGPAYTDQVRLRDVLALTR
ncbi:CBS domain-containing protein [Streptomyces durmitorensis]|uniref:CBS domain-containing protein n=1 Tax=Streptomyces durmitorensis TaxID=319947 RepID=A0ABY4Q1T5_9ACTN|nr:CBS domain-containing protein [Streptomyces durmitorensis]UQT60061.1 CBS domain-containing protein [Streptomyces durmitorensis]